MPLPWRKPNQTFHSLAFFWILIAIAEVIACIDRQAILFESLSLLQHSRARDEASNEDDALVGLHFLQCPVVLALHFRPSRAVDFQGLCL